MATTQPHHDGDVPVAVLDGAVKEYPREVLYLITFGILFVITAIEVTTYFASDFFLFQGVSLVVVLVVLGGIKFVMVAQVFMHLRFDKKVLSVVFYSGLILAICAYIAVMTIFRLWWPSSHMVCQSAPAFPTEANIPVEVGCPPAVGNR